MANPEHLEVLRQGVKQWNKWRLENRHLAPNLGGADLGEASLGGAGLHGVDLRYANLRAADLRRAALMGANLNGSDLNGAGLSEAWANGTIFANIDLSSAKGLETIHHGGPSTVGIDTIYKSHGKIPEKFLRGAGVPDEFIEFISLMTRRPIEFYSCFISYSTKDQEFAERLHADLQAKGVRCWFAPHDVRGGEKLDEQIDKAIRMHDRLLLILSEHSIEQRVGEDRDRHGSRSGSEGG